MIQSKLKLTKVTRILWILLNPLYIFYILSILEVFTLSNRKLCLAFETKASSNFDDLNIDLNLDLLSSSESIEKSVINPNLPPEIVSSSGRAHLSNFHKQRYNYRSKPIDSSSKLRNNWCHFDCSSGQEEKETFVKVCGSDGRWYSSLCELKRQACLKQVNLFKRHHNQCLSSVKYEQDLEKDSSNFTKDYEEHQVRIIELKKRCNLHEFREMKSLLLKEFNGNIDSMFKYFDTNGNQLVEAHELWPKQSKGNNLRQLYGQLWDEEHSERCHSFIKRRRGRRRSRRSRRRDEDYSSLRNNLKNNSKCWFFLDFPFEPQYASNPCSLSHLVLFELPPNQFKFNLNSFRRVFSENLEKQQQQQQQQQQLENNNSLVKQTSTLTLELGQSREVECQPASNARRAFEEENELEFKRKASWRCLWTRYNTNLASIKDPHISVNDDDDEMSLSIKEAQLYLSGKYKCECHGFKKTLEHELRLQVRAKARVEIRPKFQWSLPDERVSFECLYDSIDTKLGLNSNSSQIEWNNSKSNSSKLVQSSEFSNGNSEKAKPATLQLRWFDGESREIVDAKERKKRFVESKRSSNFDDDEEEEEELRGASQPSSNSNFNDEQQEEETKVKGVSPMSSRASFSLASSRLVVENIKLNDSGQIRCSLAEEQLLLEDDNDTASLLVQEQPPQGINNLNPSGGNSFKMNANYNNPTSNNYLWLFHDNGISIYKLASEDAQEMELLREINGQSSVNAEVDGNWNQLTLCGGLNSEQAVICEWSDNAVTISVDKRRYVYVGQPNLNRVLVMDGDEFEIVAIINTEPQPRKLFLYKPSKIHLSKWVRRRFSPAANKRWLSLAIKQGDAHPLEATPIDSKLYSEQQINNKKKNKREIREKFKANMRQFDIWLLCYGQPFVLNPSGEQQEEQQESAYSNLSSSHNNQPFTPRLPVTSSGGYWPPEVVSFTGQDLEGRLRNRKSVHIIQSTFMPIVNVAAFGRQLEESPDELESENSDININSNDKFRAANKNSSLIGHFQHSTVLTTHHIYRPQTSNNQQQKAQTTTTTTKTTSKVSLDQTRSPDLIHELIVPPKAHSLEFQEKHKIHYAYVTHYNQQSLFRVNMDEYKYDKEIDLQDCDPINLITSAQGLLVVQCRQQITHKLIGQLVLDELTGSRVEFNANIRAQEAYLSPDHKYLISIYIDSEKRLTKAEDENLQISRESIIYVQRVGVNGLELEYEIKTVSLKIGECSFVWKDGYYVAIIVSNNFKEQQSELLSLRLADGRLELVARAPGLMSSVRHKDQLVVSSKLRLAALTSSQGRVHVVDLEENRVLQTLRRHLSAPTLLWLPS